MSELPKLLGKSETISLGRSLGKLLGTSDALVVGRLVETEGSFVGMISTVGAAQCTVGSKVPPTCVGAKVPSFCEGVGVGAEVAGSSVGLGRPTRSFLGSFRTWSAATTQTVETKQRVMMIFMAMGNL
jgi:hypothetical protein